MYESKENYKWNFSQNLPAHWKVSDDLSEAQEWKTQKKKESEFHYIVKELKKNYN